MECCAQISYPICLSACLSVFPSIHWSIDPSIHPSIDRSIYPSIHPPSIIVLKIKPRALLGKQVLYRWATCPDHPVSFTSLAWDFSPLAPYQRKKLQERTNTLFVSPHVGQNWKILRFRQEACKKALNLMWMQSKFWSTLGNRSSSNWRAQRAYAPLRRQLNIA